jgi:photoactive yellow protein
MSSTMASAAWQQGSQMALTGSCVASPELLELLDSLTPAEIDELPFGVIKADDFGVVALYNRGESMISGMDPAQAVGRNFFTNVAPCTNNKLFRGTFAKGVENGSMNLVFFYTFTYRMAPTEVKVQMFKRGGGANWILVQKK